MLYFLILIDQVTQNPDIEWAKKAKNRQNMFWRHLHTKNYTKSEGRKEEEY
jgi:hypothetical protein